MDYNIGDIVKMKKPHPCGSKEWKIVSIGNLSTFECVKCGHLMSMNKEKAMTVFSNYTDLENVNNSVVSPAVQRAIESVTGNYDIYDILGDKRTEVYEAIDKALKEKFES